jgi:uncharacterized damage-inducible protein DinB
MSWTSATVAGMTDFPWEPPIAGTERQHLTGALDRLRTTFRWKADGLAAEGLSQRLGRSALTLGGLLKHLAVVEDYYFTHKLGGAPLGDPWPRIDWDADPDWEFRTATTMDPAELRQRYRDACDRARQAAASAESLDQWSVFVDDENGWRFTLRWVLLHLIEETARHAGHADLLREAIDGAVGE